MTRMRKRFWRSWSHSNVEIGQPPAQNSSFMAAGMTVSNGMEAIMTGISGLALRRNVLPSQRVGELHSAVIVDAVFGIAPDAACTAFRSSTSCARTDCDIARAEPAPGTPAFKAVSYTHLTLPTK